MRYVRLEFNRVQHSLYSIIGALLLRSVIRTSLCLHVTCESCSSLSVCSPTSSDKLERTWCLITIILRSWSIFAHAGLIKRRGQRQICVYVLINDGEIQCHAGIADYVRYRLCLVLQTSYCTGNWSAQVNQRRKTAQISNEFRLF